MKFSLMISLLFICLWASSISAQPQIYLVRHAEKLAGWPGGELGDYQPLNAEGLQTAERLADYLSRNTIKTVFSSSTTRTLHTALLISRSCFAELDTATACSDTAAIEDFLHDLQDQYAPDEAVVIVSHSNIIPYFLTKSGLSKDRYAEMGITSYGEWLLTDNYGDIYSLRNWQENEMTSGEISRISAEQIETAGSAFQEIPFTVDPARVSPGSFTLQMSLQDDSVGTAHYDIQVADNIWTLTEHTIIRQHQVDTKIVSRIHSKGLRQLDCRITGTFFGREADIDIDWKGEQVSGYSLFPRGASEPQGRINIDRQLPPSTIERTAVFFLLPAMPLQEHSTFILSWLNTYNNNAEKIRVDVADIVQVNIPAGEFPAYQLRIHQQPPVVAYVSAKAPHRLLKMDLLGQPWRYVRLPADND